MGGDDTDVTEAGGYVFETTVLSSFSLGERLDLLEAMYGGSATWTLAVRQELFNGLRDEPNLGAVLVADWLGEAQAVYDVEQVERVRLRLGGRARDDRHLGEATSIVLAQQHSSTIAVDDRDAKTLAEGMGLPTMTTVSILRRAIQAALLTPEEGEAFLADLIDRYGRRLPRLSAEQLSGAGSAPQRR